MSLTDVDLPALKLLMRRILEARHAGDRSEAFSLLRAQLLRQVRAVRCQLTEGP